MKPLKVSVEKTDEAVKEQPNPQTLMKAISILEAKVEEISKRSESLLNLIASV